MIRRFNRFELKYLIPVAKAEAICADLAPQMLADAHGGTAGYRVCSLYYDSPEKDFFWDKIDGIRFRRKVRIRVYPQANYASIEQALVEIKQRINRTVQKRRLLLPLDEAYSLCANRLDRRLVDPADESVASEVRYLVDAKHLEPSCIIDYRRLAYVGGPYNPGLRITFDTDLRCRTRALQLNQNASTFHFLPPDWCIMEVKVDETVPDWVSSLLISHNCELRRVSKYCAGLAKAEGIQVSHLAVTPLQFVGPESPLRSTQTREFKPRIVTDALSPRWNQFHDVDTGQTEPQTPICKQGESP